MSTILTNELGPFTGTDIAIASGKTITGAASQFKITGGSSGQFLTTDGSGGLSFSASASGGTIVKMHDFVMSTRTSGNASANTDQFTITSSFLPVDPVVNNLFVNCAIPTGTAGQNWMGMGLRFNHSGGQAFDFFGQGIMTSMISSSYMNNIGFLFNIPSSTLIAGSYSVALRVETASSNHAQYNINSSDDARIQTQTQTHLVIQEWKNP